VEALLATCWDTHGDNRAAKAVESLMRAIDAAIAERDTAAAARGDHSSRTGGVEPSAAEQLVQLAVCSSPSRAHLSGSTPHSSTADEATVHISASPESGMQMGGNAVDFARNPGPACATPLEAANAAAERVLAGLSLNRL